MRVRLQTTPEHRDPGASGPATPVDAAELERRAATALARVRSTYRGRPRALIQRAIRTALADAVGGALTVPDLVRAATGIHHGHFVTVYVQPAVGPDGATARSTSRPSGRAMGKPRLRAPAGSEHERCAVVDQCTDANTTRLSS